MQDAGTRQGGAKLREDVNVIWYAADFEDDALLVAEDAADVFVKTLLLV